MKQITDNNDKSDSTKLEAVNTQESSNITYKDTSDINKSPTLKVGNWYNISGMCNIEIEISSPNFYEPSIENKLKWETALDLKKFYNHNKICLNAVTKIRDYFLPYYQVINK